MDDRGSIIIETIIALAIVAMILATCYEVVGDGARRERRARDMRMAVLTARSQLAAVGTTIPLDGTTAGIDGAIDWWVEVRASGDEPGAAGVPVLVTVSAAVRNDPGARVTLRSIMLAPAA